MAPREVTSGDAREVTSADARVVTSRDAREVTSKDARNITSMDTGASGSGSGPSSRITHRTIRLPTIPATGTTAQATTRTTPTQRAVQKHGSRTWLNDVSRR